MTDTSVFLDRAHQPTTEDLSKKLDSNDYLWTKICDITLLKYPSAKSEWNFPGKKYGWSFRIKDKRRAIIYLLPRDGFFKVAFVFGEKAMKAIMKSSISGHIKDELHLATKYAEGRGIRILVEDETNLSDIEQLIDIKLKY